MWVITDVAYHDRHSLSDARLPLLGPDQQEGLFNAVYVGKLHAEHSAVRGV
jgi:hypothetical protein